MKISITFLTIISSIYAATTPMTMLNKSGFNSAEHEIENKKSNRSGRIVGGEDAYEGEFPFIVSWNIFYSFPMSLCPEFIDSRHTDGLQV